MSIAYQAVVLFAYILPGVLFRKRLSSAGQFRHSRSLADELAQSFFYAAIGHAIWIAICSKTPLPEVDLRAALMHAMGQYGPDGRFFDAALGAVTNNVFYVLAYFLSLNLFAFSAGSVLRWVHAQKWWWCYRVINWLHEEEPAVDRFRKWSSVWERDDGSESGVPYRLLATVVELGKTAYLYVGKLETVHFDSDGDPTHFVLSNVMRRPLENTGRDKRSDVPSAHGLEAPEQAVLLLDENPDQYHSILGDSFVVRASEARTLNVLVRYLSEVDESNPKAASRS